MKVLLSLTFLYKPMLNNLLRLVESSILFLTRSGNSERWRVVSRWISDGWWDVDWIDDFFWDVFAEHLEWRNLERWKSKLKDILKTYMLTSLWVLLLTPELLFKETEIAQLESQGIFKSQGLVCFYAKAEMTSAALPQIFLWIQNHVHVQQKRALVKSSQTKKCWLLFPINIFQYLECFPFWVLCWESRFSATPKRRVVPSQAANQLSLALDPSGRRCVFSCELGPQSER